MEHGSPLRTWEWWNVTCSCCYVRILEAACDYAVAPRSACLSSTQTCLGSPCACAHFLGKQARLQKGEGLNLPASDTFQVSFGYRFGYRPGWGIQIVSTGSLWTHLHPNNNIGSHGLAILALQSPCGAWSRKLGPKAANIHRSSVT